MVQGISMGDFMPRLRPRERCARNNEAGISAPAKEHVAYQCTRAAPICSTSNAASLFGRGPAVFRLARLLAARELTAVLQLLQNHLRLEPAS